MPVLGLPYALEIMMQQLQAKGTLSSWQIYEEKSGSVCVKVRFDCHDSNQSTMENTLPVTYKRKNEKQIHRDKKRAEIYSQKGMTTRSQTRMSDVEQPRGSLDYLDGETHDLNISDIATPCSATPVQVETRSPLVHDSPQQTLPNMHMGNPETSPLMDVNKPETTTTINKQSADHDHGNDSDTSSSTDQGNDSIHNVERPLPKDEDNSCSLCGISPGMCWRRCTHTDHTSPFNICNICYHDGNSHSEHEDQLNMYYPKHGDTCPLLCDSCGTCFHTKTSTVIKCEKCAHMYLLCNDCFKSNRHKGHAFHMVKICAGQL